MCTRNVDIVGNTRECVAFECSPNSADGITWSQGSRCELWNVPAHFAGATTCDDSVSPGHTCTGSPSGFHCYVKDAPAPSPPPSFVVPGYSHLLNGGNAGPCRASSPTDNLRSAWNESGCTEPGCGLIWYDVSDDTIDCNTCADMCTRNVDIVGNTRECVAFECSPNSADGITWSQGSRCELWNVPAHFAGATTCDDSVSPGHTCTGSPSGFHCYVKNGNPNSNPHDAVAAPENATHESADGAILGLVVVIFLLVLGMASVMFVQFFLRRPQLASEPKIRMLQMDSPSDEPSDGPATRERQVTNKL